MPNVFELFGVDFLVSREESDSNPLSIRVSLLEFNAEPAIELTGPRLAWTLEDLFVAVAKRCVQPFLDGRGEGGAGEAKNIQKEGIAEEEFSAKDDETSHLITCLQELRGA